MRPIQKTTKSNLSLQQIEALAIQVKLPTVVVKILVQRGYDNEQAIRDFLYCDDKHFYDPFVFKNMRAVCDRLLLAAKRQETVVIYGDYDCDGICSSTILYKVFGKLGINAVVHIPNRYANGYGLKMQSIEELINTYSPSLIVSCDCGISGVKEVELTQELGVQVIVTDHHEPSDILPNCLIINPKQAGCNYPDKNLCGTGIALKLAVALGEHAYDYVELACVATIADMVVLVDENRLIVQKGLEKFNKQDNCNLGLDRLIKRLQLGKIASQDIAFKIAPKINAVGRMGDPQMAFELLASQDVATVDAIIDKINLENDNRKLICKKQYDQAIAMLQATGLQKPYILLKDDAWEKGLTGILAARLVSEFKRPVFVLAGDRDGRYKATARSVEGINLYQLLTMAKSTLVEYGGHSAAAGFTICGQRIGDFDAVIDSILSSVPVSILLRGMEYDVALDENQISVETVEALDILEPYGTGNTRPLFGLSTTELSCKTLKAAHIKATTKSGLEVLSFGDINVERFEGNNHKELVLDIGLNKFNGRTIVNAKLQDFFAATPHIDDDLASAVAVLNTCNSVDIVAQPVYQDIKLCDIQDIVQDFGTLVLVSNSQNYKQIAAQNIEKLTSHNFLYCDINNNSKILVAPILENIKLGLYNKIILDSKPANPKLVSKINALCNAQVFVCNLSTLNPKFDMSRQAFAKSYNAILQLKSQLTSDILALCKVANQKYDIPMHQFAMCFKVFEELGILNIQNSTPLQYDTTDKKTQLNSSKIYKIYVFNDK